jgi:hypothetical protein
MQVFIDKKEKDKHLLMTFETNYIVFSGWFQLNP